MRLDTVSNKIQESVGKESLTVLLVEQFVV